MTKEGVIGLQQHTRQLPEHLSTILVQFIIGLKEKKKNNHETSILESKTKKTQNKQSRGEKRNFPLNQNDISGVGNGTRST